MYSKAWEMRNYLKLNYFVMDRAVMLAIQMMQVIQDWRQLFIDKHSNLTLGITQVLSLLRKPCIELILFKIEFSMDSHRVILRS